jgi:hypothetical protein
MLIHLRGKGSNTAPLPHKQSMGRASKDARVLLTHLKTRGVSIPSSRGNLISNN